MEVYRRQKELFKQFEAEERSDGATLWELVSADVCSRVASAFENMRTTPTINYWNIKTSIGALNRLPGAKPKSKQWLIDKTQEFQSNLETVDLHSDWYVPPLISRFFADGKGTPTVEIDEVDSYDAKIGAKQGLGAWIAAWASRVYDSISAKSKKETRFKRLIPRLAKNWSLLKKDDSRIGPFIEEAAHSVLNLWYYGTLNGGKNMLKISEANLIKVSFLRTDRKEPKTFRIKGMGDENELYSMFNYYWRHKEFINFDSRSTYCELSGNPYNPVWGRVVPGTKRKMVGLDLADAFCASGNSRDLSEWGWHLISAGILLTVSVLLGFITVVKFIRLGQFLVGTGAGVYFGFVPHMHLIFQRLWEVLHRTSSEYRLNQVTAGFSTGLIGLAGLVAGLTSVRETSMVVAAIGTMTTLRSFMFYEMYFVTCFDSALSQALLEMSGIMCFKRRHSEQKTKLIEFDVQPVLLEVIHKVALSSMIYSFLADSPQFEAEVPSGLEGVSPGLLLAGDQMANTPGGKTTQGVDIVASVLSILNKLGVGTAKKTDETLFDCSKGYFLKQDYQYTLTQQVGELKKELPISNDSISVESPGYQVQAQTTVEERWALYCATTTTENRSTYFDEREKNIWDMSLEDIESEFVNAQKIMQQYIKFTWAMPAPNILGSQNLGMIVITLGFGPRSYVGFLQMLAAIGACGALKTRIRPWIPIQNELNVQIKKWLKQEPVWELNMTEEKASTLSMIEMNWAEQFLISIVQKSKIGLFAYYHQHLFNRWNQVTPVMAGVTAVITGVCGVGMRVFWDSKDSKQIPSLKEDGWKTTWIPTFSRHQGQLAMCYARCACVLGNAETRFNAQPDNAPHAFQKDELYCINLLRGEANTTKEKLFEKYNLSETAEKAYYLNDNDAVGFENDFVRTIGMSIAMLALEGFVVPMIKNQVQTYLPHVGDQHTDFIYPKQTPVTKLDHERNARVFKRSFDNYGQLILTAYEYASCRRDTNGKQLWRRDRFLMRNHGYNNPNTTAPSYNDEDGQIAWNMLVPFGKDQCIAILLKMDALPKNEMVKDDLVMLQEQIKLMFRPYYECAKLLCRAHEFQTSIIANVKRNITENDVRDIMDMSEQPFTLNVMIKTVRLMTRYIKSADVYDILSRQLAINNNN
tara:strand:- start:2977 stop:6414 length:3438 start_codon:yes stop_codon:yes gene_type:complete